MKSHKSVVFGQVAASVRLTPLGAALSALVFAVPGGFVIAVIDWLWL